MTTRMTSTEGQDEEVTDELQKKLLFERQKEKIVHPSVNMTRNRWSSGNRCWFESSFSHNWLSLFIVAFTVSFCFSFQCQVRGCINNNSFSTVTRVVKSSMSFNKILEAIGSCSLWYRIRIVLQVFITMSIVHPSFSMRLGFSSLYLSVVSCLS
jgi:hypothetical protein